MDILVEERDGGLWVAGLQKGRLEALEIDTPTEEVRWGSLYRGRVTAVNKTLDAVFVDLDGLNTGILYNRDVRLIGEDGTVTKGGAQAIGKMFSVGDLITVQAKTAYIPSKFSDDIASEDKVVRLSMDITIQGRYLVFCPYMVDNRVSSRIGDKKLRKQLTDMLDRMDGVHGFILRSAASGMQTDILRREVDVLQNIWDNASLFTDSHDMGLIMLGPDAVQRALSDQAIHQIDRIEITTMDHFHHVEDWCSVFAPDLITKIEPVELDDGAYDLALFFARDITGQIESLLQPYMLLPGGGNIIIQPTAALTAVDVNAGGDKTSHLSVNIEAAHDLARQMRLRNMGGMIVVDFLRMNGKADEQKFLKALKLAVASDPCTVQVHGKTALGLWELTRNRRTALLDERLPDDWMDEI